LPALRHPLSHEVFVIVRMLDGVLDVTTANAETIEPVLKFRRLDYIVRGVDRRSPFA
jgi:hypothetical protein